MMDYRHKTFFLMVGLLFALETFLVAGSDAGRQSLKAGENPNQIKGIMIDFFGPIYRDAYKEFERDYETQLKQFLEAGKFVPGSALEQSYKKGRLPNKNASYMGFPPGYPGYYRELSRRIDKGEIEEWEFYGVLSLASGESTKEIQALMNKVENMLNEETCVLIKNLKQKGLRVVFVSNIERPFLDQFLSYKGVGNIPNAILTSSETPGLVKPNLAFLEQAAAKIGLTLGQVLYIDDSSENIDTVSEYGKFAGTILYKDAKQLQEILAQLGF